MLTASLTSRRAAIQACAHGSARSARFYSNEGNPRRPSSQRTEGSARTKKPVVPSNESTTPHEPSLFEQLFPDQRVIEKDKPRQDDIPRLPIRTVTPESPTPSSSLSRKDAQALHWSRVFDHERQERANRPAKTSVLVLRNASKTLVEDDFRRLIPQGKHLEGWKLDEGDIVRVIPGRDLNTLAQKGYYFLLFSSAAKRFHLPRARESYSSNGICTYAVINTICHCAAAGISH